MSLELGLEVKSGAISQSGGVDLKSGAISQSGTVWI